MAAAFGLRVQAPGANGLSLDRLLRSPGLPRGFDQVKRHPATATGIRSMTLFAWKVRLQDTGTAQSRASQARRAG